MISTPLHHLDLSSVDMDYMFVLAVLTLSCLARVSFVCGSEACCEHSPSLLMLVEAGLSI